MVDIIKKKKCANQSCTKTPVYGKTGSKKREFCSQHVKQGMVNVASKKKCANEGCTKRPSSYGIVGGKKPEFCAQHVKQGMVNICSNTCADQSCTKRPSYGVVGSKRREFCSQHAKQGMVNVASRKCANESCAKQATYGIEGSKRRQFCAQHAKQGMIDIRNKKCTYQGCIKRPSYGIAGSKISELCVQHAKQGTVRFTCIESNNGTSRKRARRNDTPMAPESSSVQITPARTRRISRGFSAGLGLAATPDMVTPIVKVHGLALKSAESSVEAVPSGKATEPLFAPASEVTVKVELYFSVPLAASARPAVRHGS